MPSYTVNNGLVTITDDCPGCGQRSWTLSPSASEDFLALSEEDRELIATSVEFMLHIITTATSVALGGGKAVLPVVMAMQAEVAGAVGPIIEAATLLASISGSMDPDNPEPPDPQDLGYGESGSDYDPDDVGLLLPHP